MDKLGEPTLVRYSSEGEDKGGDKLRLLRPRTLVYMAIMVVLSAIFALLLTGRHELAATVSRTPGALYQIDPDGQTRNTYMLQVENRSTSGDVVDVAVTLDGLPDNAALIAIPMSLQEGESKTIPLVVTLPVDSERVRNLPFEFVISTPEDSVSVGASFKSGN
jgi:polyferredoxin